MGGENDITRTAHPEGRHRLRHRRDNRGSKANVRRVAPSSRLRLIPRPGRRRQLGLAIFSDGLTARGAAVTRDFSRQSAALRIEILDRTTNRAISRKARPSSVVSSGWTRTPALFGASSTESIPGTPEEPRCRATRQRCSGERVRQTATRIFFILRSAERTNAAAPNLWETAAAREFRLLSRKCTRIQNSRGLVVPRGAFRR